MRVMYAPIAQPDRVTGYEPVGRGFESLSACFKIIWHFSVVQYRKMLLFFSGDDSYYITEDKLLQISE